MREFTTEEEADFLSFFPPPNMDGMRAFADGTALHHSRYMVTYHQGRRRLGYCTHCRREMVLDGTGWRTGQLVRCPMCGTTCMVKYRNGIKNIYDRAVIVWYDKSPRDPRAIVARAYTVRRIYSHGYKNLDTEFVPWAAYIFEPAADWRSYGRARMATVNWGFAYDETKPEKHVKYVRNWEPRSSIYSLEIDGSNMYPAIPVFCSENSIRAAAAGTPFAWLGWETAQIRGECDYVRFFALAARYPCVEYLLKRGLDELIAEKLEHCGGKVVNWRARTPWGVLRLTKPQLKVLKPLLPKLDSAMLEVLQSGYRDGSNYSPEEALKLTRLFPASTILAKDLLIDGLTTIRKAAKYLTAQSTEKNPSQNHMMSLLRDWKDYIIECRQLGLNLEDDRVLYPKALREAHAHTSSLIKAKGDALINKNIRAFAEELEASLTFESGELMIRPAVSADELIREGKLLRICVGGMYQGSYIHKYAAKSTILLLLRRVDVPDIPFYCVEIQTNGHVLQVRGNTNCAPTPEVAAFMDFYRAEVLQDFSLKKLKNRNRIQIAI